MFFKIVLVILGIAALTGGFYVNNAHDQLLRTMAADPVCTTALTLQTPEASGPTCVVVAGTVARKFTHSGAKSSTDYVVVRETSGTLLNVALSDQHSAFFANTAPGARAVVETIRRGAAFVATDGGTASAQYDPNQVRGFSWILFAMGAGLFFMAFVGHVRGGRGGRGPAVVRAR